MRLTTFCSVLLTYALVTSSSTAHASAATDIDGYLLQVSTDSANNYNLSFYAEVSEVHDLDKETYDYSLYKAFLANYKDGIFTTTEERVQGLINAIQHFTVESPRSFSLAARAERLMSEESGETQRYNFCVHFGPVMKSNSCIRTSFVVDEMDLIAELDTAGIEYEITNN